MKKIILLFVLISILSPIFVNAQQSTATQEQSDTTRSTATQTSEPVMVTLTNPLKGVDSIGDLFYKIVDFVMGLSYVVIAFFLLYSGFKFVTAQGSDEKLTEAKTTFKYTIIGALILIGANTIIKVIQSIVVGLQG